VDIGLQAQGPTADALKKEVFMTLILSECYGNGDYGVKCYGASVVDENGAEFPLTYPVEATITEAGTITSVDSQAGFFCTQYGMANDLWCKFMARFFGRDKAVDARFKTPDEYKAALARQEEAFEDAVGYFNVHRENFCESHTLSATKKVTYGLSADQISRLQYAWTPYSPAAVQTRQLPDLYFLSYRVFGQSMSENWVTYATWDDQGKISFLDGPRKGVEIFLTDTQVKEIKGYFPLKCPE
jgi:hypothetical protein